MSEQLFTRTEAAEVLRISVRTLDRRTREGKIHYLSDGRGARVYYRLTDLEAYLDSIRC